MILVVNQMILAVNHVILVVNQMILAVRHHVILGVNYVNLKTEIKNNVDNASYWFLHSIYGLVLCMYFIKNIYHLGIREVHSTCCSSFYCTDMYCRNNTGIVN